MEWTVSLTDCGCMPQLCQDAAGRGWLFVSRSRDILYLWHTKTDILEIVDLLSGL